MPIWSHDAGRFRLLMPCMFLSRCASRFPHDPIGPRNWLNYANFREKRKDVWSFTSIADWRNTSETRRIAKRKKETFRRRRTGSPMQPHSEWEEEGTMAPTFRMTDRSIPVDRSRLENLKQIHIVAAYSVQGSASGKSIFFLSFLFQCSTCSFFFLISPPPLFMSPLWEIRERLSFRPIKGVD